MTNEGGLIAGGYSAPPSLPSSPTNPSAAKFAPQGDVHMRTYTQIKFLYYPLAWYIKVASRVAKQLETQDLRKLGNISSFSTSQNDSIVPSLPAKMKILSEIKLFPLCAVSHENQSQPQMFVNHCMLIILLFTLSVVRHLIFFIIIIGIHSMQGHYEV